MSRRSSGIEWSVDEFVVGRLLLCRYGCRQSAPARVHKIAQRHRQMPSPLRAHTSSHRQRPPRRLTPTRSPPTASAFGWDVEASLYLLLLLLSTLKLVHTSVSKERERDYTLAHTLKHDTQHQTTKIGLGSAHNFRKFLAFFRICRVLRCAVAVAS